VSAGAAAVEVHGFGGDAAGPVVVRAARGALRALRCPRLGAGFCAVEAAESARLNRAWRHRAGPADVLSFASPPDRPGGNLGEVYLCLPLVRRRARRLGIAPRRWIAELAVHGLLHLMGFHHGTPEAARRMGTVQAALVRSRGGKGMRT